MKAVNAEAEVTLARVRIVLTPWFHRYMDLFTIPSIVTAPRLPIAGIVYSGMAVW